MANKKPLNISEEAAVQMPMKTVASLIIIVALGTMGYFQIIERLNVADTRIQIMEKDLEENTEFRIKWPRGQLGSLPADSEQFMMIEDLYKTTDKINKHVEDMALNKVNIQMAAKTKNKLSKFEWVKKNIVIVPVVAAILAGTFTSVRYVLSLTDTIEANKQTIINLQRDLTVAEDKLTEVATRLSAAEATWEMAENLYRQLADQVREHAYDIKDLNR